MDENADFGPNEVTKKSIGDISLDADNPYDTAAPGVQMHKAHALLYLTVWVQCLIKSRMDVRQIET